MRQKIKLKLFSFKSIRTNLIFWFLFLALAPLFIGILISFTQEKRSIENETFNKLITIRDLKVQQLERWFNERLGDIQELASDFEIRALEDVFGKEKKSSEDIEKIEIVTEHLKRSLKYFNNNYSEIFIVGAKTGLVEIGTNQDNIGGNKSHNSYFTVPLESGEIFIKDIYYSNTSNKAEMTISIPIFCLEHNTHVIGILVSRINLEKSLYELLLNRVGLGETGETLIVNEDVMALNDLRWYEKAPLKLKIDAEPALNASQGKTGIIKTLDYRGEEVLAAYTNIPRTGWGVICKQDIYELNEPIRMLLKNFVVLLIVSVIIIVLLVFWISKRISKPIFEMNNVARKIKAGDYSARNIVLSRDELGSLAGSINEMVSSIESRNAIQKGVTKISEGMVGQASMQIFCSKLLKLLMKIVEANMATFYIVNEESGEFEHIASIGANKKLLKPFSEKNPEGEIGNAILTKSIYYLHDIPENTIFKFKTISGEVIPKEIITIPILVEDVVVAIISLVSIKKFNNDALEIIKQSWMNINSSYLSLLGSERTRILAEHLYKINQQLETKSEELQNQTEELQNQAEELQETSNELQEQNLELEHQRKHVEEANRMKSDFLSNMSHELRTPLNSILALSRVLIMQAKAKLNDEENNYLEIVERNGKQLLSLINDILDLSKIESGKIDIHPEFVSINYILNIIKENMQSLADEKSINLNLQIPENLPKVETDESRLHQAVLNIVSNAVKFTQVGSVDISVKSNQETINIEVKDTGIGISAKDIPYIFDEFRQVDGSTSRQFEGTGLGLAIASKMIKILGGNIKVESKLGEGSIFRISLPIIWHKKSEFPQYLKLKDTISQKESNTILKNIEKSNSKKRILIVEDNEVSIIQLKNILENENYIVDIAHGGKEALDYVKETVPDGIILDLMMPEVDGFEVLEKIRNTERTEKIPVLILTAKDLTKDDLKKLRSNNIQQLIFKGDIDKNGLLLKVKHMVGIAPNQKSKNIEIKKEGNKDYEKKKKISSNSGIPHALIVEDNPDNMTTIKAILSEKFNISEAVDGEQGLMKTQSLMPDIVLLDMALPIMAGEEVVKILKNNEKTRNIPVIALTARAMKEDKEKFMAAGCDGYIPKPIDPEALLGKIWELINND
ncbi:MAG: response regulator [Bacteroidales bacterium]|nr:response regulator [Bacteroidales bacterium]